MLRRALSAATSPMASSAISSTALASVAAASLSALCCPSSPRGAFSFGACESTIERRNERAYGAGAPRDDSTSSPSTATSPLDRLRNQKANGDRHVIYRARGMVPLRLAVRLKVFHLLAAASAAGPAATIASGGTVPALDAALAAALAASAGGAAVALAWLSRRYVGEISVPRSPRDRVTISTLGFWGERVDSEFDSSAVVPVCSARAAPEGGETSSSDDEAALRALFDARPLLAFDVEGDRQFLVSLKLASFCDAGEMMKLLLGGVGGGGGGVS